MEDSYYKRTVRFSMTDDDSQHSFLKVYDDAAPWTMILNDFIKFMESAGYVGITKKVAIEESPYIDQYWDFKTYTNDDWK